MKASRQHLELAVSTVRIEGDSDGLVSAWVWNEG